MPPQGQLIVRCSSHVPTSISVKSSVKTPVFVYLPTVSTNRTTRQTPAETDKVVKFQCIELFITLQQWNLTDFLCFRRS